MAGTPGLSNATEAARASTELYRKYNETGLPIVKGANAYTVGRLGQIAGGSGLPTYVKKGYEAAKGGIFDESIAAANVARARASGPAEVRAYQPAIAGASADVAKERAGVNFSSAVNGLNERLGLMKVAAGGAADASNLSIGFGNLGLRGIAGMSGGEGAAYGAVQGGLSAILGAYGDYQTNKNRSSLLAPNNYVANSQYAGQRYRAPAGAGPVPFD